MRFPEGAKRWASVPPPAPVPMMMTSNRAVGRHHPALLKAQLQSQGGSLLGVPARDVPPGRAVDGSRDRALRQAGRQRGMTG